MGLMGNRYDLFCVNEWPAYHPDAVLAAARRIREKAMESNKERKETQMAIKGNNLKAEMARREMGSRDLGEMLGIGKHAVEAYCDDMTTMPVCVLWQVARIFHCSTDWLLGMSNEREPKSPSRW